MPPSALKPSDQVFTSDFRPELVRRLHRSHWATGWPTLPLRVEDHCEPLLGSARWIAGTRSAAGLLFLDDRNCRCGDGGFCAQAAGGSAISADHDYRGAAPGIRRAGEGYHPTDRVGPVSAAQRHSLSTEPLQQLSLYRTLPRTSGFGGSRFGAAARSRKSWLA